MSIYQTGLAVLSLLTSHAVLGAPLVVHPGGFKDLIVTHSNTLNATTPAGAQYAPPADASTILNVDVVNYLNSNNVKAYVVGKDSNGQLVFVNSQGQFYYPSASSSQPEPIPDSDIAIPMGGQGSTTHITVPNYMDSTRVWFSDGSLQFGVVQTGAGSGLVQPSTANPSDPNANTNFGFGEFDWSQKGGVFADISFVDFVGLPVGIELTTTDGSPEQSALGLPSNAVNTICEYLKGEQNADGQVWGDECVYNTSGELLRVIAPVDLIATQSSAWSDYYTNYINQVFEYYSTNTLTIDTQLAQYGEVACTADTSSMTISCAGDNRVYNAPTVADIWGCNSGPFAIEGGDNPIHVAVVPRLCAAFNRGTLLLNGGNVQPSLPPSSYYTSEPFNWYSYLVHAVEKNGKGYAFAYDDVAASGGDYNVAGTVQSNNPATLTFLLGGYDLA